jgi:hypothetical protein
MSATTHQGGCLCGALRYEAQGPPGNLCFCHCASCRRAAGATPVAWATFATDRFRVTRGALALHESSPRVERGFCAACGTSLSYAHAARAGEIDVTIASLDQPAALRPLAHIWVADGVDWAPLADGLPQFAGWRSDG